jgi:DUF4097 and DUF4098 domain-containing protein YvlB
MTPSGSSSDVGGRPDMRFEVGGRPRVEVRIARGRVRLTGGETGVVTVTVSGSADGLLVDQAADVITIREESGRGRRPAYDITLAVPEGTLLEADLASAELRVDVRLGELRAHTASGDVSGGEIAGSARIRTASGDVFLGSVTGDAEVTTASGDVRMEAVGGRLACATASGDVHVRRVAESVDARTVSGELFIDVLEGPRLEARSVSGDVTVGLPRGRRVSYDFKTMSGRVHLPQSAGGAPEEGERTPVSLRVKSVSGDVTVRSPA